MKLNLTWFFSVTIRKFKILYITCIMFLPDSAILDLLILCLFPFHSGAVVMGFPSGASLSGLVLVIGGLKVSIKPLNLLYLIYLSK